MSSSNGRDKSERGWLIELKAGGVVRAMWFAGNDGGHMFTHDANKAIRFAREQDAQQCLDAMLNLKQADSGPAEATLALMRLRLGTTNYTVTEHEFV